MHSILKITSIIWVASKKRGQIISTLGGKEKSGFKMYLNMTSNTFQTAEVARLTFLQESSSQSCRGSSLRPI